MFSVNLTVEKCIMGGSVSKKDKITELSFKNFSEQSIVPVAIDIMVTLTLRINIP